MTAQNPFKYGEPVSQNAFCNRHKEIRKVQQAIADGQNLVVVAPPRWGKSSLVSEAVSRYRGKHIFASIDCFGLRSSDQFFESYLHAVLQASSARIQQAADTMKKHLVHVLPFVSFSAGEKGNVGISVDLQKRMPDGSLLDLPQKIARERKARFIIRIGEFDKIREWDDGQRVLELLRAHWQKHHDVTYCLCGGKRSLTTLIADSSQPFYRFGESIFLDKIDKQSWSTFLQKQFEATGKKMSRELAELIVDYTDAHSFFVQYLGRLCWSNTPKTANRDIIDQSYAEFLNNHRSLFLRTTERLTRYQVNYLKAFISGERQFSSQRVSRAYDLGSPGNIKRIEKALEDNEIMDYTGGPELCDPFFAPLFKKTFY